jgi:predicted nucleic acid-binding protein
VIFVIDASVTLKWLLADAADEQDVDKALALLDAIEKSGEQMLQPSHWKAEVLAVIARRAYDRVPLSIAFIDQPIFEFISGNAVLDRAADLSHRLNHHLFDTLYHAVALEHGATLITADERYFAAASAEGAIERLRDLKVAAKKTV